MNLIQHIIYKRMKIKLVYSAERTRQSLKNVKFEGPVILRGGNVISNKYVKYRQPQLQMSV